jgi:DNA helicase II / ATP-dependent DNA helicase PcrA
LSSVCSWEAYGDMTNLDGIYDVDDRAEAFENHENGILVSLAGPGTGKTYSLLKRIEALTTREEEVDSICYLTFIKEISNAFGADYIEKFGAESYEVNKPRISTLHSFACRLIRNQGFRIGYDGELSFTSITDSDDGGSETYLNDLLPLVATHSLHTIPQLKEALERVKVAWRDCIDPFSLEDSISDLLPVCLELLRAYRLIDWDQTIPPAYELFHELQEQPIWISQIKHFLIDEYQDFNRAEQEFITTLSAISKSMVIVGDDDQSLYSGRGGSPDGLREMFLSEEHDRVSLLRCRRCKSRIVTAANTFLAAICPNPRPMLPLKDGGEIRCFYFKSSKAEIAYLAKFLSACIDELPESPKPEHGTVCLFPSWRVLDFYFDRLSPHILCSKRKSTPNVLRLRMQEILELICHPNKRFLQRLILERYDAIKSHHKREMVNLILQRDISPADAVAVLIGDGVLTGRAASQASAFCELCNALASQDPRLIAQQISGSLNVDVHLLSQRLETFLQYLGKPEQEEAINHLCDELIPDSAQPPEDPRAIMFLTMHGSKGLTKNTVVMPGLEEAWLPGIAQGNDLEERRRLFYVALTRATDRVLITYPLRRARGDPLNYAAPGRSQPCSFVHKYGLRCYYHA